MRAVSLWVRGLATEIEASKRSQRTRVGKCGEGGGVLRRGTGYRGEPRRLGRVLEGSGLGVQGLLS